MFKNVKNLSPTLQLFFLFGVIVFGFFQYMFVQGIIVLSVFPGIEELSDEEVMKTVMTSKTGVSQILLILQQLFFFLLPALLMNYLLRENGKGIFKWEHNWKQYFGPIAWMILGIVSLYFLFYINVHLIDLLPNSEYFIEMDQEREGVIEMATSNESVWLFLLNAIAITILPAIGEEMIFRGFLIRNFYQNSNNIYFAVFGSSALFALIHFQPLKFIPMFMIGLLLALFYVHTKNLLVPIIAHFINNIISLISTKYPILEFSENLYFSAGASLILLIVIVYYVKKLKEKQIL
ncbi:MAG: CPBP family intramembrane metalloprotease [Crocinitomicaceae bacterium]|nr:CPBP family intramembrane metalloprotease [Crocinitomicaceae bacterium]